MSGNQWCQDVPRDEAVRAAEDAAAVPAIQHRDLPEIVAALRERVARLEHRFAAASEIVAPPQPDPASPAEGMRTERVTLEVTHDCLYPAAEWVLEAVQERFEGPTESVRVVEQTEAMKCMTKLRRERDAARADAERLRARVAELEAAKGAGGAKQEPVAWGVMSAGEITQVSLLQWRDSSVSWSQRSGGTVVPLYARSSPPRVKVPKELQLVEARGVRIVYDAAAVKKVIRAAGVEVEG